MTLLKIKNIFAYEKRENLDSFFYSTTIITSYLLSEKKDKNNAVLKDSMYAIGVVTFYDDAYDYYHSRQLNTRHPPSIKFYFYQNKKKILIKYSMWKKIPDKGIHVGDKFLVAYLKSDPEKCLMFFDRPIKDSIDYQKYLIELGNKKKSR